MQTGRVQPADWAALEQLYRINHPTDHAALARRRFRSQAFVSKDPRMGNKVVGFAVVSYGRLNRVRLRGVIDVLEIDRGVNQLVYTFLVHDLVGACLEWLEAQGCTRAAMPALMRPEYADMQPQLGMKPGSTEVTITGMRPEHGWEWALDGQTGLLYPETGPQDTPPGRPPQPVQVARRVWN